MSAPLITGFHHVAIRARDYDRTVAFYTETMGFTLKIEWHQAPSRAAMLDAGDGNYLEVFERPDQAPADTDAVIIHFALRTAEIDTVIERVRAAGAEITTEPKDLTIQSRPQAVPVRLAFCKGPNGEVIEFFQNALT